jgi:hypothetical protein
VDGVEGQDVIWAQRLLAPGQHLKIHLFGGFMLDLLSKQIRNIAKVSKSPLR